MSPTNRIAILVVLAIGAVMIGVGVATLFNAQYAVEPIPTSTIQTQISTQLAAESPSAPSSAPAMVASQAAVQQPQDTATTTSSIASPTIVTTPATSTLQLTEVAPTQPSSTLQPTTAATTPPPQSTELAPTQPSPTSSTPSAANLLQQVAAVMDALQRGQIDATIQYPQETGARSQAQLRFEFGKTAADQRLQIVTTYQSDEGPQTSEQIMIGDTTWSRQSTGEWTKAAAQTTIHHQVQPYLPDVSSVTNPTVISNSNTVVLRWYDAARDAEVTLTVDPTTGMPQQMRQLTRATGSVLTVNYSGWDEAVDITSPDTN